MPKPPNYRPAEVAGRNCGTCRYIYKVSNNCRRYNVRVRLDHVCKTWKALTKKGEHVMDLTKLSAMDLAYLEGFIEKCGAAGVDAEALLDMWVKRGRGACPRAIASKVKATPAKDLDDEMRKLKGQPGKQRAVLKSLKTADINERIIEALEKAKNIKR